VTNDDPTPTPLGSSAVQLHEIFRTLVDSGFSEWQACRIIGVMIAEGARGSRGE
jgi:hypothetical protein